MTRITRRITCRGLRLSVLPILGTLPLISGCTDGAGPLAFASIVTATFTMDLLLMPVRSIIGTYVLNLIHNLP